MSVTAKSRPSSIKKYNDRERARRFIQNHTQHLGTHHGMRIDPEDDPIGASNTNILLMLQQR